jgi:Peptidase A4 family
MRLFSKIRISLLGFVAVLLGIALAGMLVPVPVFAASPDSQQPDAATVARARAAFVKYMSSHRPAVRVSKPGAAAAANSEGVTSTGSLNWSGFADVEGGSKTVSSVSGEWVIPAVQCPGGNYKFTGAYMVNWVGIDGATNGTVEQLGSGAQCFEGVLFYYVWYEMFPAGTVIEGTTACINTNVNCPQPGDFIHASVSVTPSGGTNKYNLSLTDFTRPQESFSVTKTCAPSVCTDQSAEWIVERPAYEPIPGLFQFVTLVNYSQTGFYDGTLTSGGKTTRIGGFQDGSVEDFAIIDDSISYFLDCVGQKNATPELLPFGGTNPFEACPAVSPVNGAFNVAFDSGF